MQDCTEGGTFLKILLFLDIQIAQDIRIIASMKNGLLIWVLIISKFCCGERFAEVCTPKECQQ
jgi:hypothetical protein